MPQRLKASIVITCYNKARYISRAINSCINQNFPSDQFEIIIIDDASTDGSRDAISVYRGFGGYHFIKTNFLKKNMGSSYACNLGVRIARGEYLMFVDGDDYIHKDFLKVMTEVLDWNPDIGFVYCDLIVVTDPSSRGQRKLQLNTLNRLLNHGAAVAFRKKCVQALGGWDENLRNCYDYDLLLRYRKKYRGYHLRLPYYRYFKEGSALSMQHAERRRLQKIIRLRHAKT